MFHSSNILRNFQGTTEWELPETNNLNILDHIQDNPCPNVGSEHYENNKR